MKSLTITLWNIQGIQSSTFGCKTNSVEFQKNISNIDIIILHETWRRSDEATLCPTGYREIAISSRKNKGVTQGTDSDILIWHKVENISLVKKRRNTFGLKLRDNSPKQPRTCLFALCRYCPLNPLITVGAVT